MIDLWGNKLILFGLKVVTKAKELVSILALVERNSSFRILAALFLASCMKFREYSCETRSYSHFPTFGLNTERYSGSLRIQSECRKMQNRIPPNTDTFYAVLILLFLWKISIQVSLVSESLFIRIPRKCRSCWSNVKVLPLCEF